jgi:DNA-binding response OmpR family regulator
MATKLLIVEDDEEALSSYLRLLEDRLKCQFLTGENASVAWRIAKEELPEVILLDLGKSVASGYELMERFQAHEDLKRSFVLFVSGSASTIEEKLKGLELGAYDCLAKPVLTEELVAKLRVAIRHKEGLRQLLEEREQAARAEGILQAVRTFYHRVNNPLQTLTLTLELLEKQNISADKTYLSRMKRLKQATERISRLVQDFGRINQWETVPSPGGDMLRLPGD